MASQLNERPMLQRVAQVLAGGDGEDWVHYVDQARKVILAMREPTVEMLEAARPGLPFADDLSEDWDAMMLQAANDPTANWQQEWHQRTP